MVLFLTSRTNIFCRTPARLRLPTQTLKLELHSKTPWLRGCLKVIFLETFQGCLSFTDYQNELPSWEMLQTSTAASWQVLVWFCFVGSLSLMWRGLDENNILLSMANSEMLSAHMALVGRKALSVWFLRKLYLPVLLEIFNVFINLCFLVYP